ncbi:MAG: DUF2846 domain-containing protein [Vicinamibacterales bacterium]
MPRTAALVALAVLCCSSGLASQQAQQVNVDTVLVLRNGQEIRGQFVGFRNGLFTLRLPDGKITIHGVGDVDRMQPLADAAPSAPPAAPPAATQTAPAPAPAAAQPQAMAAPVAAPGLESKGCGPDGVRFPTVTDKTQHPTPTAPSDKGLVYVIRPTNAGSRIQTRLAVDGTWIGANYGNNYFFVTVDPGEHHFCSQAEDRSVLSLNVQAGKTYYLLQTVTTGMMRSRSSLQVVTDQDGQDGLTKSSLSVKREPKTR